MEKTADAARARELLKGGCNLALVKGGEEVVRTERGIRPLLELAESGKNFKGFAAADRIVGKAAAMLYVLLGVESVYAETASEGAVKMLVRYRIPLAFGVCVPVISNRRGDGLCPMECAVLTAEDPAAAPPLLHEALARLQAQNQQ